ncbi:MAG: hypothetical protein ACI82Z_001582, partial [Cellvibrionaceae bacterium]
MKQQLEALLSIVKNTAKNRNLKYIILNKIKLEWAVPGKTFYKLAKDFDFYNHEHYIFPPVKFDQWRDFFRTDLSCDKYLKRDPYSIV